MPTKKIQMSVVVPVYNEESCLSELYQRLSQVLSSITDAYEIIFVDDGSKDNSWQQISDFRSSDNKVRGIKFSRNFGHHVAITAGLDYSRGQWVVAMDADLQDLPEEIPKLYEKALEGYDVVLAKRTHRQHNALKFFLSKAFNRLLEYMSDMSFDSDVGIFRILSRRVVDKVCSLRESSRFISGIVEWVGFSQGFVEVTHGARFAGETKYPLHKQIALAAEAILSFTDKPLRITVYLGVLFAIAGSIFAMSIVIRALLGGISVLGYASLMSAIMIIGGITIATVGLVGLYVGRIFREVKQRPLYVVEELHDILHEGLDISYTDRLQKTAR